MSQGGGPFAWASDDGSPDGLPIGRAFAIAPGIVNDELRDAVAIASRVHGDGVLPTVPLLFTTSISVRGRLVIRDGAPSAILINYETNHRSIAVFHEIGHFLDLSGAGDGRDFASATSPLFADWFLAVVESPTFKRLDIAIDRALSSIPAKESARRSRFRTLRLTEELWARAYAQYIVVKSGRPDLAAGMADLRLTVEDGITLPLQWDEDEFQSIADQIERLFRRLGWRSGQSNSLSGRG